MSLLRVALLSTFLLCSLRAETNQFSVAGSGGRRAQESAPTNQTPPAAWGPVCEGFSLALVFPKAVYTNGEPIVGKVIVRNTTTGYLEYYANVPTEKETIVTNEQKEKLPLRESLRPKTPFEERLRKMVQDPHPLAIAPGRESTFQVRLDDRYDMSTPGTYTVVFHLKVPKRNDPKQEAEATSAPVLVRVLKQ